MFILFLCLSTMYVLLAITTRFLLNKYSTTAAAQHLSLNDDTTKDAVKQDQDLEDEHMKHLIDDKVTTGSLLKKYFTVVCLLKEMVYCSVVFLLYKHPAVSSTILTIM